MHRPNPTRPRLHIVGGLACLVALLTIAFRAEAEPERNAKQPEQTRQQALEAVQEIVGEWRGVGQPKRGSRRGAWFETGEWVWAFPESGAELVWQPDKQAKLVTQARVGFDEKSQTYTLTATLPKADPDATDAPTRTYTGTLDEDGHLVFVSEPAADAEPGTPLHLLTIRTLSDKRMTMLYQTRVPEQTLVRRVAEVGFTRQGESIAGSGSGGPICVVTGGRGTMAVSYKGKTYYVCCSGCKQAFDADPDGVMEEYFARIKQK